MNVTRRFLLITFAVLTGLSFGQDVTHERATSEERLNERLRATHLLNRCAFGPRPGEVEEVVEMGWEAWVEQQLLPETIPDYFCEKHLEDLNTLRMDCPELMATDRKPGIEVQTSVLYRAVDSDCQLQEVMLEFWRNHFCISLDKGECSRLAAHYEKTVLRKHVFGRFEDMLVASAKHPAMLIYLDNYVSQKPLTRAELKAMEELPPNAPYLRQLQRQRGLNENYARELLELHTLGVDNGYTQRDVWDTARILTGWTVDKDTWTFMFRPRVHDENKKKVLGKTYRSVNTGPAEGEALLHRLANDKRTAQFISMKMCRYLVDDNPPAEMVERVAKVFRDTDGDLREVTRAIIYDPEFFNPRFLRSKFKTPYEFCITMFRALDCVIDEPEPVFKSLKRMRQPIFQCQDPTGYFDVAEAWLDPGVLPLRWQLALNMVTSRGSVRIPDDFFVDPSLPVHEIRDQLIAKVLPSTELSATTHKVLQRICERGGSGEELQRQLLGILLGCPEFQRQ